MWRIIQSVLQSNAVQEISIETPPTAVVVAAAAEKQKQKLVQPFTEMDLTNFMNGFYTGTIQYERERFERRRKELNGRYGSFVPFSAGV
jgi:hypothetical protein